MANIIHGKICYFVMAVGMIILIFVCHPLYAVYYLKTEGVKTIGLIINSELKVRSGKRMYRSSTYYVPVTFSFMVGDEEYKNDGYFPTKKTYLSKNIKEAESFFSKYRSGSPVIVYYESENPNISILDVDIKREFLNYSLPGIFVGTTFLVGGFFVKRYFERVAK